MCECACQLYSLPFTESEGVGFCVNTNLNPTNSGQKFTLVLLVFACGAVFVCPFFISVTILISVMGHLGKLLICCQVYETLLC